MSLSLTSSAFTHQGEIPARYSCEVKGREISPPLAWSGVPGNAKSLALIVDDPDVPDPKAPKRTWVHWVLYGLPAAAGGLAEGVDPGHLPPRRPAVSVPSQKFASLFAGPPAPWRRSASST